MKRRLTGIELHRGGLSAVELKASGGAFIAVKKARITFSPEAGLDEALDELFDSHGFSRRSIIAVSPPEGSVFLTRTSTALPKLKQIRTVIRSQVEDNVPLPFEDIVADTLDLKQEAGEPVQRTIPAAAMSRKRLSSIISAFDQAGAPLSRIAPASSVLKTVVQCAPADLRGGDFIVLHFDSERTFIAFYSQGAQTLVRNMPALDIENPENGSMDNLIRETGLTWRRLYGATMPEDTTALISIRRTDRNSKAINRIPGNIVFSPIESLLKNEKPLEEQYLIPTALATRAKENECPNFLAVLKEEARATKKPTAHIATALMLMVALAAAATARLFINLNQLESSNTRLDEAIEKEIGEILPRQEQLTVPAYMLTDQIKNELEELRQRQRGLQTIAGKQNNPVALLSVFQKNIPEAHDVRLERINAAPDRMQLNGSSRNFAEAEELQRTLSELDIFKNVEMSLSSRSGTSRVDFVLDIDTMQ